AKAAEFAGVNKTYEKFNSYANANSLTKRIANNLLQNDRNIAGLESPRELIRWAFRAEKGDISTVFEFGDMYVVAALTQIREEGIAPLEQVTDDVKIKAIKEKKAAILAEKAKSAMKSNDINEVARTLNITVARAEKVSFSSYTLPSAGIEPNVIGTASASVEGKLVGPVKGNNGVYVLAIVSSTKEDGDVTSEQFRLNNMYQSRAYYEAYEALKTNANIVDKRYNFY
ncbi:MAG TPA: peptidyl-prolyl cis-trans isomerase, partial [Tenuifilaceae bacterium]|nr:peptidyl-prolyl cis-trans isomerase [Tenuifilaceae bacterium]